MEAVFEGGILLPLGGRDNILGNGINGSVCL